jgi:hypothetical protein
MEALRYRHSGLLSQVAERSNVCARMPAYQRRAARVAMSLNTAAVAAATVVSPSTLVEIARVPAKAERGVREIDPKSFYDFISGDGLCVVDYYTGKQQGPWWHNCELVCGVALVHLILLCAHIRIHVQVPFSMFRTFAVCTHHWCCVFTFVDWCGPCQMMHKELEKMTAAFKVSEHLPFARRLLSSGLESSCRRPVTGGGRKGLI